MTEYIKRQDALDAVGGWSKSPEGDRIWQEIEEIPAADVREVVFCRDCVMWNARGLRDRESASPVKRMCIYWGKSTEGEDYCSIGDGWYVGGPNCGAQMNT